MTPFWTRFVEGCMQKIERCAVPKPYELLLFSYGKQRIPQDLLRPKGAETARRAPRSVSKPKGLAAELL